MSFSTQDVNYLIWRYFQETGLPFPAYALSNDQPSLHKYDDKYKDAVPIGSLVSLIQKGIMYSETERFVKKNGEVMADEEIKHVLKTENRKFTIFHALAEDKKINPPIEASGRFSLGDCTASSNGDDCDVQMKDSDQITPPNDKNATTDDKFSIASMKKEDNDDDFIFVPQKIFSYEPSTVSAWNPTASTVLAYGTKDSKAKITVFVPGKPEDTTQVTLAHPTTISTPSEGSDITTLSWSPLGHLLVTAVESGEVRLWTAEGNLKNSLTLHQRNNINLNSSVVSINWSPDSQYFITIDMQNFVVLWDPKTGSVVMNIDNGSPNPNNNPLLGTSACWITSSKFILPGPNCTASVYNITDRTPVGKIIGHTKPITQYQYNTEGELLLTVSDDRTIRIWNGLSFNSCQVLQGHTQEITYAAWVNKFIVVSTGLDGSLRLWDIRESHKQHRGKIPDEEGEDLVGSSSDYLLSISLIDDGSPIIMASFSPDRTKIVMSTIQGVIIVYRIDINEKGDELRLIDQYDGFLPVADDDEVVVDNEGNELLKDEKKHHLDVDIINLVTSLEWSADSKYVVCGHAKHESIVLRIC